MKITFCGAARTVTGSCYLIEIGNDKSLVDCGMFQGAKDLNRLNYAPLDFNPADVERVFLTHAHIDHCGLIPKLVVQGFRGDIYATSATIDLAKIMLEDSAQTQISETEQENKRRLREGLEPREPLYSKEDVARCFPLFKKVDYGELVQVSDSIRVRYQDAGHILGSAMIEIFVREQGGERKLVFSGDVGQWGSPIVKDPTLIESADYVFVESTYGNRLHEGADEGEKLFLEYALEAHKKGGKLLVPSFAVERTQQILYTINKLIKSNDFPDEKVFLDSPLAIKATSVFKRHRECFDEETASQKDPFTFDGLVYTQDVKDSIKLNSYERPCVIMAGSGMCTGGRIRHHFKHGLWDPKNTVLFVGYQAEGTLGRYILDGEKEVRMMGMVIAVKAKIRKIEGFSAHADYEDLLKWVDGFSSKPQRVFVVHGEPEAAESFKDKLAKKGLNAYVPYFGETVEL